MNNWGEMYKYRNGCPNVIWVACVGHDFLEELMKGGGPIGDFLYEVVEMKVDLQIGKLIVDEMEGSLYYRGAVKKIEP
jgi:hypothetical protein